MQRFANTRAEEAQQTGFVRGLPTHIARRAHRITHLLIASHGWQDIGTIDRIAQWSNRPGVFGLHVHGKWFVTFEWAPSFGAVEIRLERR
jgi:hypothetical protein